MLPNGFLSWVIYIVLALLLGALGTGIWESVLKPMLTRLASLSLRILTFGIKSAERKLFAQIAKRAPYKIALFFMSLLPFIFCLLVGYNFASYTEAGERRMQAQLAAIEQLAKVSPEMASAKLSQMEKESLKELYLFQLLLSCAGFIFMAYNYIRYMFISSAINYFEQCMSICGPYFKDVEEKQFIQDFALIASESDFSNIIHQLRKLAEINNKQLPPSDLL